MGLMDRMIQRGLTTETDTTSTTLALADAPVVARIRVVSAYFTKSMSRNTKQSAKVAMLMRKLLTDALEEASEVPPEILEFYMAQATATMYWTATGRRVPDMPLPDDFPMEHVALTVGDDNGYEEIRIAGEIEG